MKPPAGKRQEFETHHSGSTGIPIAGPLKIPPATQYLNADNPLG
jgi:hypothetical protein